MEEKEEYNYIIVIYGNYNENNIKDYYNVVNLNELNNNNKNHY